MGNTSTAFEYLFFRPEKSKRTRLAEYIPAAQKGLSRGRKGGNMQMRWRDLRIRSVVVPTSLRQGALLEDKAAIGHVCV